MGCDHAGYPLKEVLKAFLEQDGHEVLDFGTDSEDTVDYPDFCAAAARAVVDGRADRGIVLGGSGQGEQLAANKVKGARAALCNDLHLAELPAAVDLLEAFHGEFLQPLAGGVERLGHQQAARLSVDP